MEEVEGLHEIRVSATDANGQPQVITVFAEGGNVKGLPQSLLDLGNCVAESGEVVQGTSSGQKLIIQEITFPEGMNLEQGIVLSNPGISVIKRVTPRGSGEYS